MLFYFNWFWKKKKWNKSTYLFQEVLILVRKTSQLLSHPCPGICPSNLHALKWREENHSKAEFILEPYFRVFQCWAVSCSISIQTKLHCLVIKRSCRVFEKMCCVRVWIQLNDLKIYLHIHLSIHYWLTHLLFMTSSIYLFNGPILKL